MLKIMIKSTYTHSAYELCIEHILIWVCIYLYFNMLYACLSLCVCVCVLNVFCMKVNASYYILYVTLPLNHVINCGPMHGHIL